MSYPLLFDPGLAVKIGLKEAIILQQVGYWVKKNKENQKNFHDGYYWTYNSFEAWQQQFPFWAQRTLQRGIKSLNEKELIKIGNYNKVKFDHTLWYTLTEKGKKLLGEL